MKAMVFGRFGTKEVLELKTISDPFPLPNQARIKVGACGVNNVDLQIRGGTRGSVSFPHVLGAEIAGTVDLVGSTLDSSWMGKRVVVLPFLSCGECSYCLDGNSNLCNKGTTIGRGVPGGYSEFVVVPISNLIEIHPAISFYQAASTGVSGLAAWHGLVTRSKIHSKDVVLVVAGASGVGVWAIQIAKLMEATVIATVGSEDKIQSLYDLGADKVVLHSNPEWPEQVRAMTSTNGVDIAFDAAGHATFEQSLSLLRKGGTYTFCGATTGGMVSLDLVEAFRKELRLVGSTGGTRSELELLLQEVAAKKLRAKIDSVIPLENAADAHGKIEERKHFGKIVLEP